MSTGLFPARGFTCCRFVAAGPWALARELLPRIWRAPQTGLFPGDLRRRPTCGGACCVELPQLTGCGRSYCLVIRSSGRTLYGETVGRYAAKPSMSRPPKYLVVPPLNAAKLSPPSDRKLFVTMRYFMLVSLATGTPSMLTALTDCPGATPVQV